MLTHSPTAHPCRGGLRPETGRSPAATAGPELDGGPSTLNPTSRMKPTSLQPNHSAGPSVPPGVPGAARRIARGRGWPTGLGLGLWLAAAALQVHPAELTVQDGLVLWLKADAGVTTEGGASVTAWQDQSPNANHAGPRFGGPAEELPQRVAGVVGGKPVIRFDGVDDVLEIPNSASLQPLGGSWTVFFVAQRLGASQGDFPQIIGSRPWMEGLDKGWSVSLSAAGNVASHLADGIAGHDVPGVLSTARLSTTAFEIWQVEEDRPNAQTAFYRNFDLDRRLATSMPSEDVDQVDSIYLGREIGGSNNRRANLDLAEVIIYNRVLSAVERTSVTAYLNTAYSLGLSINNAPTVSLTSPTAGLSVSVPATVTLTALATDIDGTVRRVEFYEGGTLLATATAAPFSVPVSVQSTGNLLFTAVATDDRGASTTSPAVPVTATGAVSPPELTAKNGLQLWLKADGGVQADGSGAVSGWQDQSSNGNDAGQDDAGATPPDSFRPLLVADAVGGKPAVRFDGVDDFLVIPNSPSLQPLDGDWTVAFVGKRAGTSRGDYPQIVGSRPWNAGLDKGWAVAFGQDGRIGSHYADGVAGHDAPTVRAVAPLSLDTYELWQIEENRSAGFTRFYLTGRTNNTVASPMPSTPIDQINDVYLGSEVEGSDTRRANLDLAELLVYNRALSDAERGNLTEYLRLRYNLKWILSLNQPPTVQVDSPVADSVLNAPASLTLKATAADSDGSLARVEFFLGTRSLGAVSSAPFELKVTVTSLGAANVTAVATDNFGAQTTSAPVPIRVVAPDVTLIGKVDYSDTFTLGGARTDGLYNNNANGAYGVEDSHGNPAATWTPTANFSFNTPGSSTDPAKVGAAAGNSGAATGLAQSGGGDSSFAYGLQTSYVVQVQAILPTDRLDITSLPTAGGGIFAANSLSVFLRRDSATTLPGIGLFNGAQETGVTNASGAFVRTGVNDNDWHNFAVHFDQPNRLLRVYVDGVLIATVNLASFADGLYQNYSNGAVGVGGAGGVFWLDNFKVGAPPELISNVDYSDAFTLSDIRTDGLYNDDSGGAYTVEDAHGNPSSVWTPTSNFSFNTPGSSTAPDLLNAAVGNAGAATGLAQSGGGDPSFAYGLRADYIVQLDAILPTDRLDITSLDVPGGGIFGANKLSVFLRRDSTAGTPHPAFPDTGLPAMGLYNGSKETAVTDRAGNLIFTGVDDNHWHNYAVRFNQSTHEVGIYVDRILKVTVDLNAFADGIYRNYSNGAVGVGGAGGVFWWDNVKVGAPTAQAPTPTSLVISRDGGSVVISWSGAGTLEVADDVTGAWNPLPEAASPYTVTPNATRKFYRLKQQ